MSSQGPKSGIGPWLPRCPLTWGALLPVFTTGLDEAQEHVPWFSLGNFDDF